MYINPKRSVAETAIRTSRLIKHLSPKREQRREKFRKLGRAISSLKQGDPNAPDYHTGKESSFAPMRGDQRYRDAEDPLNKTAEDKTQVPYGPEFKTPQWERTLR